MSPEAKDLLLVPSLQKALAVGLRDSFITCFLRGVTNAFSSQQVHVQPIKKLPISLVGLLIQPESSGFSFPSEKAGFLSEPIEAFLLETPRLFMQYLL